MFPVIEVVVYIYSQFTDIAIQNIIKKTALNFVFNENV